MATKIHWEVGDLATQCMVDPMLDDAGIEEPIVRAAARKFGLQHLEESISLGWGLNMGDWQYDMIVFAQGYETALKDNHLL